MRPEELTEPETALWEAFPAARTVDLGRLKCRRAVATRYDKLSVRYEVTVLIAAIDQWL